MAATKIGLATLTAQFGTLDEASSVVKSYEETIKCDPVELLAGDGTFKAVAFANPNYSVNITLVSSLDSGAGSAFAYTANTIITTLPTSTLFVDSITRTLTNDGFTETQFTASGWDNYNSPS